MGEVEKKLRKAWHKELRFVVTRGVCYLLLWAVALVLADLVIDWWLTRGRLGAPERIGLLAVNVLALLWIFYSRLVRHLRPFDPVRVALQVERRHPELKSLLVSYIQFSRPGSEYGSPELLGAVRRQAVDATRPINFREIVNYRELGKIFAFAAAVVVVFAATSVQSRDFFLTLMKRLLDPSASVAYPTRTRIEKVTASWYVPAAGALAATTDTRPANLVEVEGGDLNVPQGATVAVTFACSGLVPADGRLEVRPENAGVEKVGMVQSSARAGTFVHNFGQVFRSMDYTPRIGDYDGKTCRINIVRPPKITSAIASRSYPDYMGRKPSQTKDLNIETPENTTITWEISFESPLKKAQMLLKEPLAGSTSEPAGEFRARDMQLDASGRRATFTTPATASFPYRFRWTEASFGYEFDSGVEYFVQVTPDGAPDVQIVAPVAPEKATMKYGPTITFAAEDDFGLTGATLVSWLENKPDSRLRRKIDGIADAKIQRDVAWKVSELSDVKEGSVVCFAVEVVDNSGKKANVMMSRPVKVEIVSEADYMRLVVERINRQVAELVSLRLEETGAAETIRTLSGGAGELTTQESTSRPSGTPASGPGK